MSEAEDVLQAALDAMRSGMAGCLVTIVETRGSTPRQVGTKMLVRPDGTTVGTIGGGEPEAQAIAEAGRAIGEGRSCMSHYSLLGTAPGELGICGGEVTLFLEVLGVKPTLLVVGAGHIAQPLVALAAQLGYRTVVVDDRMDLVTAERFPKADQLIAISLDQLADNIDITSQTYIVIVTRAHEHDALVLAQVVGSAAAYVGMIGSRKKVRTVMDKLLADGVAESLLSRVYAPIGLGIGGETPVEIALSIMSEIALVRYGGSPQPLSIAGNPFHVSRA